MNNSEPASSSFLISGGTGLVGRALARELRHRRMQLVLAVRQGREASQAQEGESAEVVWDPQAAKPFARLDALEGVDVAIHLSGANLAAHRWSAAYKREIVNSRTGSTGAIARSLAALRRPPRLLIAASATGIYGDRGAEILTEASTPGMDFLSETCQAWEAAASPAADAGIPVIYLRLGVVLDPAGGALAKVLPLFKAGLGGELGSGEQWMSWIAIDDLVRAVMHLAGCGADSLTAGEAGSPTTGGGIASAAQQPTGSANPAGSVGLAGPVNCVSPQPVTNAVYTRALADVLHRPAFARAPAFALRLAMGEMADAALLASCRAVPSRLEQSGFVFRYPAIGDALAHLLPR